MNLLTCMPNLYSWRVVHASTLRFHSAYTIYTQVMLTKCTCCLQATSGLYFKMLAGEDQVETIPSRVPETVLDEEVELDSVRKYFTDDGWLAVLDTVKTKKKNMKWRCNECRDLLGEDLSVVCDLCFCWFHQVCSSLTSQDQNCPWFCQRCTSNV